MRHINVNVCEDNTNILFMNVYLSKIGSAMTNGGRVWVTRDLNLESYYFSQLGRWLCLQRERV